MPRHQAECRILGYRICRLLGMPTHTSPRTPVGDFYSGPRPVDEASAEKLREMREEENDYHSTLENWFRREDFMFKSISSSTSHGVTSESELSKKEWSSTLAALSSLLTSSYVVSLGSDHLMPWPNVVVAPLSPGYVGGFLAGSDRHKKE